MMALLHMAGLENSECISKIQRKPEVAVSAFLLPHFSLICDSFADPIISLHSRDISLFDCHI
jgi:hypothetical protein